MLTIFLRSVILYAASLLAMRAMGKRQVGQLQPYELVIAIMIAELAATGGKVIATGGGAVLDPENVRALKQNGTIVFLDRAPENLVATDDRPLASRRSALEKLYAERYDIYTAAAELRIDANTTPEAEADAILKELGE